MSAQGGDAAETVFGYVQDALTQCTRIHTPISISINVSLSLSLSLLSPHPEDVSFVLGCSFHVSCNFTGLCCHIEDLFGSDSVCSRPALLKLLHHQGIHCFIDAGDDSRY